MLRRIGLVSLLLVGSGASAAVHESIRITQQLAFMDYVAVAGCLETFVTVDAEEQIVHVIRAPRGNTIGTVSIRIHDRCTDTDLLVADQDNFDPVFKQNDVTSATFHDEFTTADDHHVQIDVAWTQGETGQTVLRSGSLRTRENSPDRIASLSDRRKARACLIAGTLVVDGVSTDLSAASGLLLLDTRNVFVVAR